MDINSFYFLRIKRYTTLLIIFSFQGKDDTFFFNFFRILDFRTFNLGKCTKYPYNEQKNSTRNFLNYFI